MMYAFAQHLERGKAETAAGELEAFEFAGWWTHLLSRHGNALAAGLGITVHLSYSPTREQSAKAQANRATSEADHGNATVSLPRVRHGRLRDGADAVAGEEESGLFGEGDTHH